MYNFGYDSNVEFRIKEELILELKPKLSMSDKTDVHREKSRTLSSSNIILIISKEYLVFSRRIL